MKLWKVCVSGDRWQGGDYNGSWTGFCVEKFFSTKEKAVHYMKNYVQPKYEKPHKLSGPYVDTTHVD